MNTKNWILSLCVPAAMIACSSPSSQSAGPSATPVPTERAGNDRMSVSDKTPTSAGLHRERTGEADGLEKWTNVNFSNTTPMTASLVHLDEETAKACAMSEGEVYFSYDSAKVDSAAEAKLARVADCLKNEEGRVTVIGYTDPRGTDAYNDELGMSRAESVARVLEKSGVPADRVSTKSEGETGEVKNPAGWPIARRVEIRTAAS